MVNQKLYYQMIEELKLFTEELGFSLETITEDFFGKAVRAVVTKGFENFFKNIDADFF